MTNEEVTSHLDQFKDGASYLVSDDTYNSYIRGKNYLGRDGNTENPGGALFCIPKEEMNKVLEESGGDIDKIEDSLGLERGSLGDGPLHRVDVDNPMSHNIRMATGNEPGANPLYNTYKDGNDELPKYKQLKDDKGYNVYDKKTGYAKLAPDTPRDDMARLKGGYVDPEGNVHEPETEGYRGLTSGGHPEAVLDKVENNASQVDHTKIDNLARGHSSEMTEAPDPAGYQKRLLAGKESVPALPPGQDGIPALPPGKEPLPLSPGYPVPIEKPEQDAGNSPTDRPDDTEKSGEPVKPDEADQKKDDSGDENVHSNGEESEKNNDGEKDAEKPSDEEHSSEPIDANESSPEDGEEAGEHSAPCS